VTKLSVSVARGSLDDDVDGSMVFLSFSELGELRVYSPNKFDEAAMAAIGTLTNLRYLQLGSTETDSDAAMIVRHPIYLHFFLNLCRMIASYHIIFMQHLSSLVNLSTLIVSSTWSPSDEWITQALYKMTRLLTLEIFNSAAVNRYRLPQAAADFVARNNANYRNATR
jgi:hypothetical protein